MWLLDLKKMMAAREALDPADDRLRMLRQAADAALEAPLVTVMDKRRVPPSGDMHDYWSLGPYWWPNPDTADGLPYVWRDGEINPEVEGTDRISFRATLAEVEVLATAYFYLGEVAYAVDAARRLRAWFLDPATRMNPNMEYAQAIPGRCEGRGIGIIDTYPLRLLPDLMVLLGFSKCWEFEDFDAVTQWLSKYLDWLLSSRHGRDEAGEHNNHGTWFDTQAVNFALVASRLVEAQAILRQAPERRLQTQIAPDGSQPHELARTRSFFYSCHNLLGLFDLATLGEKSGVDLWNWRGAEGQSLKSALSFLASYMEPRRVWPYPEIKGNDRGTLRELLVRAPESYRDENWYVAMEQLRVARPFAPTDLLWPE